LKVKFKYEVGQIIKDDKRDIIIIDRKIIIEQHKSKECRSGHTTTNMKYYTYKCNRCGNIDIMEEGHLLYNGCNVCCTPSRKVLKGYNDLWSIRPDIAKLLKNPEDGYSISCGSSNERLFVCSDCGYEKMYKIATIVSAGFSCDACSDGISYPEKFMFSVLKQLNMEVERENIFSWSKNIKYQNKRLCGNKRYDFYFEMNNKQYIIETHGGQHYDKLFKHKSSKTLEEEKENDKLKKELALKNKIDEYIVIDCRYSEFDFIKQNVLQSRLSELFDLSKIDWLECNKYACNSLVKTACDYWNSGIKNLTEIGEIIQVKSCTVRRYLKQGAINNLCDYDSKQNMIETRSKCGGHNIRKIVQLSLEGEYIKTWNSITMAQKELNICSISSVCSLNGDKKSVGGYMWMYEEEYNKNIENIKPYERTYNNKSVVQLSLSNEFLYEYDSLEEACVKYKIHKGDISQCISHNDNIKTPKSAGGYLWYLKDTYMKIKDNLISYEKYSRKTKAIVRLNLNGEYIDEFRSVTEASRVLNTSCGNVGAVCNGKRLTSKGYLFKYKEDYIKNKDKITPFIKPKSYALKPIIQLDLNNNFIKKWDGATEVQLELKISASGISQCLKGRSLSSGGFQWMYYNEYIKQNQQLIHNENLGQAI